MRNNPRRFSSLVLALAILFQWGCTPEREARIDRETFVTVYVELRVAALDAENAVIEEADRVQILERHAVSVDDLMEFAEVHGDDAVYMKSVWDEIESRLNVDSLTTIE